MITEECQHCRGIGGYTSQLNPARIIEWCSACGGSGEIEVVNEWVVSPDCRDGNCHKCPGDAWDDEADEPTECEHDCHKEKSDD